MAAPLPFVAAILGGLAGITSHLVGRVLVALGISVVVYSGLGALMDVVYTHLNNAWSSLGALAVLQKGVQALGLLQVDVSIQIILAAYAGRLTLMGLSAGGSITKLINR